MKVSGVCGAANLYRQSAMSFNLYFQALLCATLSQSDTMTAQQVRSGRCAEQGLASKLGGINTLCVVAEA